MDKKYIITFTDAPLDYDGFGTRTLHEEFAVWGSPHRSDVSQGRTLREVMTPEENVEWQRMRYQSGNYFAQNEHWFDEEISGGYIQMIEKTDAEGFAKQE